MSILTQKNFGVYSITFHTEHGDMIYIGSTAKTFEKRRCEHLSTLKRNKHCNKYLQRLWNKYQFFDFDIIEICADPEIVSIREQWHIERVEKSNLINNGPAYPSPRFGVSVSKETRIKMSLSAKARLACPEERERLRKQATGKSPSAETRKKLSDASSRFYNTPFGRAFMSAINKGKVVSQETREKLRKAHAGKRPSPQCIEAVRVAHIGKKQSEEILKKKSETMKKMYLEHPEKREQISKNLRKRIITQATRDKLRIASTGKQHTEETKEKLRQAAIKQHYKKREAK